MAEILKGLASGDALKPLASVRAKSIDVKIIAAGSADSLALKLAAEEADGWRVLRRNKRSIRLCRYKPIDRQLEDDVWSLFYRMGFEELNADRNFTIQLSENAPPRQLDVFAKDHQTAFIVECTHSRDNGAKSVKALIDKIGAIRQEVVKAVHSHYGRDPKLKTKFAIATRNIDWRAADRARAADAGVAVITEDDIAYFHTQVFRPLPIPGALSARREGRGVACKGSGHPRQDWGNDFLQFPDLTARPAADRLYQPQGKMVK